MSEIAPHIMSEAERAEAALNSVLTPLGTNLKHYMAVHRVGAIEAMVAVLAQERERCAGRAEEIGEAYGEDETGWLDCSETIATAIRKGEG